jgi:excisionase family DNA binding protein
MEPIARTPEAASPRGGACDRRRWSASRASIPTHDDARSTDGAETRQTARLPVLLTVDEAADVLRTTRRAIYAMIERRQLPGVIRIRRRVLLRADDLLHWLDQKRASSPKE